MALLVITDHCRKTTEEGNTNAQKISLQKSFFFLRHSPFPGNLKWSLAEKQRMGKSPMSTGGASKNCIEKRSPT